MSDEITDSVPGLTDEQVADLVQEVEAGHDLKTRPSEPNPHFHRVQLVPEDLLDAIDERAAKDGQSPTPSSAKRSRTTSTPPELSWPQRR